MTTERAGADTACPVKTPSKRVREVMIAGKVYDAEELMRDAERRIRKTPSLLYFAYKLHEQVKCIRKGKDGHAGDEKISRKKAKTFADGETSADAASTSEVSPRSLPNADADAGALVQPTDTATDTATDVSVKDDTDVVTAAVVEM